MNNYICKAKSGIDYCKYGFIKEKESYIYKIKTNRIIIRKDLTVKFNSVSIDVLVVFSNLVKDDVIYFTKREETRSRSIMVTPKEYAVIMKIRENKVISTEEY